MTIMMTIFVEIIDLGPANKKLDNKGSTGSMDRWYLRMNPKITMGCLPAFMVRGARKPKRIPPVTCWTTLMTLDGTKIMKDWNRLIVLQNPLPPLQRPRWFHWSWQAAFCPGRNYKTKSLGCSTDVECMMDCRAPLMWNWMDKKLIATLR